MKYLVIASLAVLAFILVYSRVRPYLQLIRKVAGVINSTAPQDRVSRNASAENRLIRCESCNTWVPADRAIGTRVGTVGYCSTECLEKSAGKKHKLAG